MIKRFVDLHISVWKEAKAKNKRINLFSLWRRQSADIVTEKSQIEKAFYNLALIASSNHWEVIIIIWQTLFCYKCRENRSTFNKMNTTLYIHKPSLNFQQTKIQGRRKEVRHKDTSPHFFLQIRLCNLTPIKVGGEDCVH